MIGETVLLFEFWIFPCNKGNAIFQVGGRNKKIVFLLKVKIKFNFTRNPQLRRLRLKDKSPHVIF